MRPIEIDWAVVRAGDGSPWVEVSCSNCDAHEQCEDGKGAMVWTRDHLTEGHAHRDLMERMPEMLAHEEARNGDSAECHGIRVGVSIVLSMLDIDPLDSESSINRSNAVWDMHRAVNTALYHFNHPEKEEE